jgi:hypothetical protein
MTCILRISCYASICSSLPGLAISIIHRPTYFSSPSSPCRRMDFKLCANYQYLLNVLLLRWWQRLHYCAWHKQVAVANWAIGSSDSVTSVFSNRETISNHVTPFPWRLYFQEREIINAFSIDNHERGTDYEDGAQPQFRNRSPWDGGIFILNAESSIGYGDLLFHAGPR